MIYFISDGEFIKIGFSAGQVAERMAALQMANARELSLIALWPGDESIKRALHEQFAHCRIRGEWFAACQELTDYINLLKEF